MNNKSYPSIGQSLGIVGITLLCMLLFTTVTYLLDGIVASSVSMLIYYLLSMSVPFILFHFLKVRKEGTVSYGNIPKDFLLLPLLLIATIALQCGVTSPLSSAIPMPESIKEMLMSMVEDMNDIYGLITVAVAAPIFEELIFRGIILDGLLKRKGVWTSILLSSFLFAIIHLNPWQFVAAFIIGCFSGWVYYRTKNLIYCIFIHFVNNFSASVMVMLDPNMESMDTEYIDLFGSVQNMILFISVCLLVALGCLYFMYKRMKIEKVEVGILQ